MEPFSLAKYNQDYPFNNFGKILLAAGEEFPSEDLGGNCIWHVKKLTELLDGNGYENIRYGRVINGGHLVVIATKDKKSFLFDRFLSHHQGICLDDITTSSIVTVDANPIVNNRTSLVEAYFSTPEVYSDADTVCLTTRKKISNGNSYTDRTSYSYDEFGELIPSQDNIVLALSSFNEGAFYVFCDDKDGVKRYFIFRMEDDSFYVKVMGGEESQEIFKSESRRFNLELAKITDQVEVHPARIKLYMWQAKEILLGLRREFEAVQRLVI